MSDALSPFNLMTRSNSLSENEVGEITSCLGREINFFGSFNHFMILECSIPEENVITFTAKIIKCLMDVFNKEKY